MSIVLSCGEKAHAQMAARSQRSNRIPPGRGKTKGGPRPPRQYRTSCDGWWSKRPPDRVQHHAPGRAEARTPVYARTEGAAATHTRATCGAALEEPPP